MNRMMMVSSHGQFELRDVKIKLTRETQQEQYRVSRT